MTTNHLLTRARLLLLIFPDT